MAAIVSPAQPISRPPSQGSIRGSLLAVVGITLVFGSALFSVNNVLLEVARSDWNKILLIQGSFNPTIDAQTLYKSAAQSKALDKSGDGLPDLMGSGKIKQYDGRIIQQADQEHRLTLPNVFFKGLPGS
ncbi:MAG: hypothetical protein ACHQ7M_10405 [Chloroflexota bacterium]